MGFRFRRGIRVGPARVNIGKRGITSVSFGRRGLRTHVSKRGVRNSVGVPGTGMSYSTKPKSCCLSSALVLGIALTFLATTLGRAARRWSR